jgi:Lysylphosphatidylglycerol synthase TM region
MLLKKVIQLVSVVTAIVALLWLLGRIGWGTIATALGSVGIPGALVLCALSLSETILDGAALCTIVGSRLRLAYAVVVNSAGSTLNLLLPWESGEILKTGLMRGYFGSQPAISGTIIWNYIFKLSRPAVSAMTAVLAWILCRDASASTITIVCIANACAFLPYAVLRLIIQYGAAEGLFKILKLIPGVRRHPSHWVELARNIDKEVRQFWKERPTAYLKVFLYQSIARMTGWWGIYAGFKFLGLPYGFAQATLVYATMNVAEYVIAILPARVGVSEGTAFFAFKFLGLDPKLGLILYVVLRVRTVFVNGILTPFAFLNWNGMGTPSAKRDA